MVVGVESRAKVAVRVVRVARVVPPLVSTIAVINLHRLADFCEKLGQLFAKVDKLSEICRLAVVISANFFATYAYARSKTGNGAVSLPLFS